MKSLKIRQFDITTMLSALALFWTKICLSPMLLKTSRTLQLATIIAAVALLSLSAGLAVAAEGGSIFYLLGQRVQGAGILPPVEGVFLSLPIYYYSASASASRGLPIGGALSRARCRHLPHATDSYMGDPCRRIRW